MNNKSIKGTACEHKAIVKLLGEGYNVAKAVDPQCPFDLVAVGKDGTPYLKQYKWRCTFRDAYYVCTLIWPWAHTKLPKINQILEHYADNGKLMNGKVVSLQEYKEAMNLE